MFNLVTRRSDDFFSPFKTKMVDHFEEIFKDFDVFFSKPIFPISPMRAQSDFPKTDIIEEEDKYTVLVALAGIPKEDVKVEFDVDNKILSISSNSTQTEESKDPKRIYHARQIARRSFVKQFQYLDSDDSPQAELKDGILKVTFNKVKKIEEKKLTKKTIEIK